MKTNIQSPATVKSFRAFEDGSNAEALLSFKGYTFACHFLGNARMTLVSIKSVACLDYKIAVDTCRKAYAELIALNCDQAWMERNAQMYPESSR